MRGEVDEAGREAGGRAGGRADRLDDWQADGKWVREAQVNEEVTGSWEEEVVGRTAWILKHKENEITEST